MLQTTTQNLDLKIKIKIKIKIKKKKLTHKQPAGQLQVLIVANQEINMLGTRDRESFYTVNAKF